MNRFLRAAAAAGTLSMLALFSSIITTNTCDPGGGDCLYCYDYRHIHESLYACGD